MPTATHVSPNDTTTQGDWVGLYGLTGRYKRQGTVASPTTDYSLPSGVSVTILASSAVDNEVTSNVQSDTTLPERANGSGTRDGIFWNSSALRLELVTPTGSTTRVRLYFGYHFGQTGTWTVALKNPSGGATLASTSISQADQEAGVYTTFDVSGTVNIDVDRTSGSGTLEWYMLLTEAVAGGVLDQTPPTATATTTQLTVTMPAPTGGTSPYTQQLKVATTATGTYSNVSGGTSSPVTVTPGTGVGTYRWYKITATDAASDTDDSVATPLRLAANTLRIGFIGDSITNTLVSLGSIGTLTTELGYLIKDRPFTLYNRAQDGSDSTQSTVGWHPSAANNVGLGSPLLTAALANFASNGVTLVSYMLGVNDGRSAVRTAVNNWVTNQVAILTALRDAGLTVVVHQIGCPVAGLAGGVDDTQLALVQSYNEALPDVVTTVGGTVYLGDKSAWLATMGGGSSWYSDGLHPNATGCNWWARAHAAAIVWGAGLAGQIASPSGGSSPRSPFLSHVIGRV